MIGSFTLQIGVKRLGQPWENIRFIDYETADSLEGIVDLLCEAMCWEESDKWPESNREFFTKFYSDPDNSKGNNIFLFTEWPKDSEHDSKASGIRVRVVRN
ncbi:hypothetical protein FVR03_01280 [Pontibacter qinzhouensis]|uniref:Uncharacterized protein n=1 Tax=Pontibacter qinzhouensis TaxID=2603253 RepID=A0A5C8KE72_9BACT|nr:hypothetical protein [Pontibacter qinzhouensis]TXK52376.1 hypothetical protein FVR03_01280 [Pontibacter qinzhouensis]